MADERISVLASLDANPPPKKKPRKKKTLANGTVALLIATAAIIGGTVYVVATQTSESGAADAGLTSEPALTATSKAPFAGDHAPSISLSDLAASTPLADAGGISAEADRATGSATIESMPAVAAPNPVAILEAPSTPTPGKTTAAASNEHPAAQPNPLEALKRPVAVAKRKSPSVTEANANRAESSARPSSGGIHAASPRTAPVDTDVVLLEALVTSSDRQKMRDSAKGKDRPKPAATETPGGQARPEPPERAAP